VATCNVREELERKIADAYKAVEEAKFDSRRSGDEAQAKVNRLSDKSMVMYSSMNAPKIENSKLPTRESRGVARSVDDFSSSIVAPWARQLQNRYLTDVFFRILNWDSRKMFLEDFRKEIFFVLVCGPFLLIEIFSLSSEAGLRCGAC